jgi:hypothetical protein
MEYIARRTDYGRHRRGGINGVTVSHLIVSDIRCLDIPVEDADHGRRISDMFFPKDALLDRLEIKLATPKSPARPDYSKVGKSALAKKRKRGPTDSRQLIRSEAEVSDEISDEDEW